MNRTRRNITIATLGTLSLAGCYGLTRLRGSGSQSQTQEQENTTGTTAPADQDRDQDQEKETEQDTAATGDDESNESDEGDTETTDDNESTESDYDPEEDDRQRRPGENETEPTGEYNETTSRETRELPASAVSVEIDPEDGVTVTRTHIIVEGRVTQETPRQVDFVEVELLFCDSRGRIVGTSLVVVRDLPGVFERRVSLWELRGEVDTVDWNVTPQRYVE